MGTGLNDTTDLDEPPNGSDPNPSPRADVGQRVEGFRRVIGDTINAYNQHDGMLLASALAFHGLLSVAPLLVFAVAVSGAVFGREAATGELEAQLARFSEPETARVLVRFVQSAGDVGVGSFATLVSFLILVWTSTRFFVVLQGALNVVFGVRVRVLTDLPEAAKLVARRRLVSFGMVGLASGLLLASMLVKVALGVLGGFLDRIPVWAVAVPFIELGISVVGLSVAVAAVLHVLPDVDISFRDAWRGGLVTALLVSLGGQVVGVWLGAASPASSYGAASSIVLFLLWAYYSSQIFIFGAQLTAVWARDRGEPLTPLPHAVALEERAPLVSRFPTR